MRALLEFGLTMIQKRLCIAVACSAWMVGSGGSQAAPPNLRARLELDSPTVGAGQAIWATFTLVNLSSEPVELTVPGVPVDAELALTGLPIEHVFSGKDSQALSVESEQGRMQAVVVGYRLPASAPKLTLAPNGSVRLRIDLASHYPSLRTTGTYRLSWHPYGGLVSSAPVDLEVKSVSLATVETDLGVLIVQFFPDDAPNHVANFIELAASGFYDGTAFHRIQPGYCIMAGDREGDGDGLRPDGRKIHAEFNPREHDRGTVSMSLWNDDPDSASSQFFICNRRVPEWDGRYTVFGRLVGKESFRTLDKLMAVDTDDSGRPRKPIKIRSVALNENPSRTAP